MFAQFFSVNVINTLDAMVESRSYQKFRDKVLNYKARYDKFTENLNKKLDKFYGVNKHRIYFRQKDHLSETREKGKYPCHFDFLFFLYMYNIGALTLIAAPAEMAKYGGIAYMIPLLICYLFMALPVAVLEIKLGQFTSRCMIGIWGFCPLFEGIGWSLLLRTLLYIITYVKTIVLNFYIANLLLTAKSKWLTCNNEWNSPYCFSNLPDVDCKLNATKFLLDKFQTQNLEIRNVSGICHFPNMSMIGVWNIQAMEMKEISRRTPVDELLHTKLLKLNDQIEGLGSVNVLMWLCSGAVWILIGCWTARPLSRMGMPILLFTILPTALLIVLMVRSMFLPGSFNGIRNILIPERNMLKDPYAWYTASMRTIYITDIVTGGLPVLGKYNMFHYRNFRAILITYLVSLIAIFFACIFTYSLYGNYCLTHKLSANAFHDTTPYQLYDALLTVDGRTVGKFWVLLLQITLFLFGFGTMTIFVDAILSTILEFKFVKLKERGIMNIILIIFVMLISLPIYTENGDLVSELLIALRGGWAVHILILAMLLAVSGYYGWEKWSRDVEVMGMEKLSQIWNILWSVLTPTLSLIFLFVTAFIFGKDLPEEFLYLGNSLQILAFVSLLPVFIVPIIRYIMTPGNHLERMKILKRQTEEWGPASKKHRRLLNYVKDTPFPLDCDRRKLTLELEEKFEQESFMKNMEEKMEVPIKEADVRSVESGVDKSDVLQFEVPIRITESKM